MNASEVGNVTVPVPAGTYAKLKNHLRTDPDGPADVFLMQIGTVPARGMWIVVGLREDYSLGGERTYWVTLEWRDYGA